MVVHGESVIRRRIKILEKTLAKAEPALLSHIHGRILELRWVIGEDPEERDPATPKEIEAVDDLTVSVVLDEAMAEDKPKPEPAKLETFGSAVKDPEPEHAPEDKEVIG